LESLWLEFESSLDETRPRVLQVLESFFKSPRPGWKEPEHTESMDPTRIRTSESPRQADVAVEWYTSSIYSPRRPVPKDAVLSVRMFASEHGCTVYIGIGALRSLQFGRSEEGFLASVWAALELAGLKFRETSRPANVLL
jgi:hypothetical protein